MSANKSVIINGKKRLVSGISEQDPYFAAITDGFEADFSKFCECHIESGYKCWDVGANIGMTSMIISDFCQPGRILALDGGRIVCDLHRKNIADNGFDNIDVMHCVMSDLDTMVGFNENSAYGGVHLDGEMIKAISPFGLVEATGWTPDFVKIDCEGHESTILKAGLDMFRKHGTLIHFEFNSWCMISNKNVQPLEFLEWISDHFEHAFVRSPGSVELEPLSSLGHIPMLWRNMTQQPYTFLDDIVVTSDKARLKI